MNTKEIIEGFKYAESAKKVRHIYISVCKELLPNIAALVSYNGGTKADAIDLLQTAISDFYHNCKKPDFALLKTQDKKAYRKYIYKMCKYIWIDRHGNKKLSSFDPIFAKSNTTLLDFAAIATEELEPDKKIQLKQAQELVLSLVNQLNNKCKQYFNLRFYKDYNNKEMAEFIGVTEGAIRQQLKDCKTPLREAILSSPHLKDLLNDFPFLFKFVKNTKK